MYVAGCPWEPAAYGEEEEEEEEEEEGEEEEELGVVIGL